MVGTQYGASLKSCYIGNGWDWVSFHPFLSAWDWGSRHKSHKCSPARNGAPCGSSARSRNRTEAVPSSAFGYWDVTRDCQSGLPSFTARGEGGGLSEAAERTGSPMGRVPVQDLPGHHATRGDRGSYGRGICRTSKRSFCDQTAPTRFSGRPPWRTRSGRPRGTRAPGTDTRRGFRTPPQRRGSLARPCAWPRTPHKTQDGATPF